MQDIEVSPVWKATHDAIAEAVADGVYAALAKLRGPRKEQRYR